MEFDLEERNTMSFRSCFTITVVSATVIVLFLRSESLDALLIAWPSCIFTLIGGGLLFRAKEPSRQLLGICMILSPLWLVPVVGRIMSIATGG